MTFSPVLRVEVSAAVNTAFERLLGRIEAVAAMAADESACWVKDCLEPPIETKQVGSETLHLCAKHAPLVKSTMKLGQAGDLK